MPPSARAARAAATGFRFSARSPRFSSSLAARAVAPSAAGESSKECSAAAAAITRKAAASCAAAAALADEPALEPEPEPKLALSASALSDAAAAAASVFSPARLEVPLPWRLEPGALMEDPQGSQRRSTARACAWAPASTAAARRPEPIDKPAAICATAERASPGTRARELPAALKSTSEPKPRREPPCAPGLRSGVAN